MGSIADRVSSAQQHSHGSASGRDLQGHAGHGSRGARQHASDGAQGVYPPATDRDGERRKFHTGPRRAGDALSIASRARVDCAAGDNGNNVGNQCHVRRADLKPEKLSLTSILERLTTLGLRHRHFRASPVFPDPSILPLAAKQTCPRRPPSHSTSVLEHTRKCPLLP